MKQVSRIEFKKKTVVITFNDSSKLIVSEDVYVQMPLKDDEILNEKKWDALNQKIKEDKCFKKALRYLNYSPHSSGLLRKKLKITKDFNNIIINQTIEKLAKLGYIDDQKFCQLFIEQKRERIDWGEYRIRQKLTEYEIKKEIIDKLIREIYNDDINELEKVKKALQKKWKSLSKKDSHDKKKQKVVNFLRNKGFKIDIIWQVIENQITDEYTEDEYSSN